MLSPHIVFSSIVNNMELICGPTTDSAMDMQIALFELRMWDLLDDEEECRDKIDCVYMIERRQLLANEFTMMRATACAEWERENTEDRLPIGMKRARNIFDLTHSDTDPDDY